MSAITSKIMLELWFGKEEDRFSFTIDDIINFFKKEDQPRARQTLKELRTQEFINQKKSYDGSVLVSLSEKGKLRALNYVFKKLENKKEKWDGKWRMVSFDIPNYSAKGRKALVYRLKSGGFYELQKSLFIYPYDCEKEVRALVGLFRIDKYVKFALLNFIDGQDVLIRHFKLRNFQMD